MMDIPDIPHLCPCKACSSPPHPRHDGGGYVSTGDWSAPKSGVADTLQTLRRNWIETFTSQNMDKQLMGHLHHKREHAPFADDQLRSLRDYLNEFLLAHDQNPNWSIPSDQRMALPVLSSLRTITQDADTSLFRYLLKGYLAGFLIR